MGTEPFLRKRELAAKLAVSTRTIERWDPPCLKVGRVNRYRLSEVCDFLEGKADVEGAEVVRFPGTHNRGGTAA